MEIGKKIKRFRTEKEMTQAELAGDFITRNMLSLIEAGKAQPSLPTVEYIAKKLNVPLGVLVSDDESDGFFRKIQRLGSIKKAFAEKNYALCRELCESVDGDDEIYLILSKCVLENAKELFFDGKLRASCAEFDRAVELTKKTIYDTDTIKSEAASYCRFMEEISPTLYSESAQTAVPSGLSLGDEFCRYIAALKDETADFSGSFELSEHLKSRELIKSKDFENAKIKLEGILNKGDTKSPLMYLIFGDLETVCREISDFKGAYEYANLKVVILEKMLAEEL